MKILKSATLLVVVCVVAILALWGNQSSQDKKAALDSESCKGCHEMQPAYWTWKETAHSTVQCSTCHKDLDIKKMRDRHEAGFVQPVTVNKRMMNDVCLQCHSSNRMITPPGDVIVPHDYHMQKGVYCVDCHNSVVHEDSVMKLLDPKVVAAKDFGKTEAVRLKYHGNRVTMAKCMVCHNGSMATKECAPCHSVLRLPENHKAQDWGYNHGGATFADLNSCVKCHSEDLVLPTGYKIKDNSRATITVFARNNLFCQNCHSRRPITHTTVFVADHPQRAQTYREGCYVCHDAAVPDQPSGYGKLGQPSTNVYCANCHTTKHPVNFVNTHKSLVAATGKAKCLTCHDELNSCIACHQKTKK